jgi:hypothetical protein
MKTLPADPADAAPYGVYCSGGRAAPRRSAARQRRGDDGTGALAQRSRRASAALIKR